MSSEVGRDDVGGMAEIERKRLFLESRFGVGASAMTFVAISAIILAILGVSTAAAAEWSDERIHGAAWLAHGFENNDSKPLIRFLEACHKRHRAVTDEKRAPTRTRGVRRLSSLLCSIQACVGEGVTLSFRRS